MNRIFTGIEETRTLAETQKDFHSTLPFFFVADCSESMGWIKEKNLVSPMEALNKALPELLFELRQVESNAGLNLAFSLISFSSSAKIEVPLTRLSAIAEVPPLRARGLTRYELALQAVREELLRTYDGHSSLGRDAINRPVVIFLTDAFPTDAEGAPLKDHRIWQEQVDKLKALDHYAPRIYVIALGEAASATDHLEYMVNEVRMRANPQRRILTIEDNIPQTLASLVPFLAQTMINPQTGQADPDLTEKFFAREETKFLWEE